MAGSDGRHTDRAVLMESKLLLADMRDIRGCYRAEVLDGLWATIPGPLRRTEFDSTALPKADLAGFTTRHPGFRLNFHDLPAPLDRELAWCCWRITELGGRVPVPAAQSLIQWLRTAVADQPELRGSLLAQTPRQWERALTITRTRHRGELPSPSWFKNTVAFLRRCYRVLWIACDPRPWWRREIWDPGLDPAIPRRPHEPVGRACLYFHQLEPPWLRLGMQWWFRVSLETGQLTWTTVHGHRFALQAFSEWMNLRGPLPPWLCEDPAGVRGLMLEFLSYVQQLTARCGRNLGQPLSPGRMKNVLTAVESFYAFMHDNQEPAAAALDEPGWLRLGPQHAVLWRRGDKGRRSLPGQRLEIIDDTAFSEIMANLHLLGAQADEGGLADEQAMRIIMLAARTGRRISEILMLDRDPLLPLDQPSSSDAQDGGFVAKLHYQQTKIEQAPDTVLVDAEIVEIIAEQQRWVDQHMAPHWKPGARPVYLFLAANMNRNADRYYPHGRLWHVLREFVQQLGIHDATGRLIDFNRTHRFRHTKATSLLNAGVPLHVVQRYMGHLSPTMTMNYAQTLATTHEREFLRYRKVTADGRDLQTDARDLYDMLELDKRTDRILPNGWCLLPPRQVCDKGNACLTCEKFTTDATFLPELKTQRSRTDQLIQDRCQVFKTRTGQDMSPDNVWLAGRRQEQDALGRIIVKLEQTRLADGTTQAVRGAGVTARTEAITRDRDDAR